LAQSFLLVFSFPYTVIFPSHSSVLSLSSICFAHMGIMQVGLAIILAPFLQLGLTIHVGEGDVIGRSETGVDKVHAKPVILPKPTMEQCLVGGRDLEMIKTNYHVRQKVNACWLVSELGGDCVYFPKGSGSLRTKWDNGDVRNLDCEDVIGALPRRASLEGCKCGPGAKLWLGMGPIQPTETITYERFYANDLIDHVRKLTYERSHAVTWDVIYCAPAPIKSLQWTSSEGYKCSSTTMPFPPMAGAKIGLEHAADVPKPDWESEFAPILARYGIDMPAPDTSPAEPADTERQPRGASWSKGNIKEVRQPHSSGAKRPVVLSMPENGIDLLQPKSVEDNSVSATVEDLKSNPGLAPSGLAGIWSSKHRKWFLAWRSDKKAEADIALQLIYNARG